MLLRFLVPSSPMAIVHCAVVQFYVKLGYIISRTYWIILILHNQIWKKNLHRCQHEWKIELDPYLFCDLIGSWSRNMFLNYGIKRQIWIRVQVLSEHPDLENTRGSCRIRTHITGPGEMAHLTSWRKLTHVPKIGMLLLFCQQTNTILGRKKGFFNTMKKYTLIIIPIISLSFFLLLSI